MAERPHERLLSPERQAELIKRLSALAVAARKEAKAVEGRAARLHGVHEALIANKGQVAPLRGRAITLKFAGGAEYHGERRYSVPPSYYVIGPTAQYRSYPDAQPVDIVWLYPEEPADVIGYGTLINGGLAVATDAEIVAATHSRRRE